LPFVLSWAWPQKLLITICPDLKQKQMNVSLPRKFEVKCAYKNTKYSSLVMGPPCETNTSKKLGLNFSLQYDLKKKTIAKGTFGRWNVLTYFGGRKAHATLCLMCFRVQYILEPTTKPQNVYDYSVCRVRTNHSVVYSLSLKWMRT